MTHLKYVFFDKHRQQVTENFERLIDAIKNRQQISFSFDNLWSLSQRSTERTALPYAIKEVKNKLYLIAKDQRNDFIRGFALDGISNLQITTTTFKYPSRFNVEKHFRHCFGIIGPHGHKHYEIILSFHSLYKSKYFRLYPLHPTQQIILDTNEECQIKLELCINADLIMELLSFREDVKILKPKSLIKIIKTAYQNALKQY